ncbi:MAG: hypothetical protein HGA30_03610 [Anaerolineales bacterium]|nr:hypothetical protein [Anaerolineales bacterium]
MTVSKGLLGVAGGAVGALGTQKALLYSLYSQACIAAVEAKSQLRIDANCPPGFNDFSLIALIGVCAGLVIVIYFWKDILQELWNRLNSSS